MSNSNRAALTPEQVERLIADTEPWLSCDECFDQIDSYVDNLAGGASDLGEPLRVHLINCAVCHEEAESLITLTAIDDAANSDTLLAAFRAELHRHDIAPARGRGWIGRLRRRR